jgi:CMP-N-acetylneuraminic acid synthetase
MKIVAMIPARLGSKRVPKKNLRLLNGRPLISYNIETAVKSGLFDEVYVNSEAEIFSEIAAKYGAKFYKRPEIYSTDKATNDHFTLDFMNNIDGEILIQILPTSPMISVKEVTDFTNEMINNNWDSLISVEYKQIACVYKNRSVNFDKLKINPPSQKMEPVKAYATVLMGWKYSTFISDMKQYGAAYHGGNGKTGYYVLRGLSTIDIDREEDFQLAERIILSMKNQEELKKGYYGK